MKWPAIARMRKASGKQPWTLEKKSDEYYEALAFRFAEYMHYSLELRRYSNSAYRGHKEFISAGGDDMQWIDVVTGVKGGNDYRVVVSGAICGSGENPFKALLERVCDVMGSAPERMSGADMGVLYGCGSVPELDVKLLAAGC